MCGIAGIISYTDPVDLNEVKLMTDTIVHRGPDGEGRWVNQSKTVGLGHRRLSILDLSEKGKQPMHYKKGRYTITYNGEIYNYLELKKDLQSKGYVFESETDTEVLLALFDFKRELCLQDLDGMFAFAIWDEEREELFCARDRFGEKPFFYHSSNQKIVFASEMKALFKVGISQEKRLSRYYQYLMYGINEDPNDRSSTFYEHIQQLKPSHYLIISKHHKPIQKKYWDIDLTHQIDISFAEAQVQFRTLLEDAIKKRLRSDVPVGSSLSGGLDSSSIVLLIDQLKQEEQVQKTFSARFKNFDKDEGEYMHYVINKTNVDPHFVYPTANSTLSNFKKIMHHQEEPIASLSIAAQFEVMKLARANDVIVLQDGQGADEILAGYQGYYDAYFLELYRTNRKKYHEELKAYNRHRGLTQNNPSLEFKWHALHYSSKKTVGNFFKNIKKTDSNYFLGINPELVKHYQKSKNPLDRSPNLKQRLYDALFKRGLSELLRYSDRNSMANSVEVRLPFLSHQLVSFLFSLPNEYLLQAGWTKYILRKSLEDLLPQEIAWRKDKIGYAIPQKKWENDPLFQSIISASIETLKKDKIIAVENPKLNWQYLMLGSI
ncbi:MAG: asparagine synthase (glutamine-hydrolyzing) [Flavobacteriales bacterium]|jgi:asparagine synthase (glutamine-hydrolysing)|nr:asparagine synthase (glutamine-hydrolyzing) [Flavobacteriales bacterium]